MTRAADVAAPASRLAWVPFASVYLAYGATFGVLGGGAPLVLRAHGLSLNAIGLIQIIYAPIGLAFLWAPLVDRFALPGLPHRIGWIGAGMGVSSVLLLLLAAAAAWPVALIFALAMAVSLTMTTTDIALEALVVETVPRERRPFVTTAKLVGSSLGTMVGVGLATAFPERLSLRQALVVVAVLDAALVLVLPLLPYPEPPRRAGVGRTRREPARTRLLLRRAALMGAFFAPAILVVTVPNLVLLDLKVSLPAVGFFTGTLTTAIGIAMTLAVGAAMTRLPAPRIVAWLAAGVAASALALSAAVAAGSAPAGYAAATAMLVFEGGLGVPVFTTVYNWAEGEQAATDFALLFGIAFLVSFPARILGPILGAALGWAPYFLVAVPFYALAVAALARAMPREANMPREAVP